jgi:pilus assembly protein CpaB
LIVTPAQANKITLAENMGEVSLIPRHPDDESVVDDSEQTADDLLNPSSANSREREQRVAAGGDEESGPMAGLRSLMEQAMAATAAATEETVVEAQPWEMQIIFPTEVTRVQFEGGRPMLPVNATEAMTSVGPNPLIPTPDEPAEEPTEEPELAPTDDEPTPDDFPIDFQTK